MNILILIMMRMKMRAKQETLFMVLLEQPISKLDVEQYQIGSISNKSLALLTKNVSEAYESETAIMLGQHVPIHTSYFDPNQTYRLTSKFKNDMDLYFNRYYYYFESDDIDDVRNFIEDNIDKDVFFFYMS